MLPIPFMLTPFMLTFPLALLLVGLTLTSGLVFIGYLFPLGKR